MDDGKPRSDALVFFGAAGDLAYKKIFPALQAIARRGRLDFPVIGVARAGWTREQLIERARASVTENGGLDDKAFAILAERLRYVDGHMPIPRPTIDCTPRSTARNARRITWPFRRACSPPSSSC